MKESIYIVQTRSVNGHGEAILSPPASRQDQYCSSLLELPGRKEGVKEKERDPPSSITSSLLCGVTMVSPKYPSVRLQFTASGGPQQVRSVQDLGL